MGSGLEGAGEKEDDDYYSETNNKNQYNHNNDYYDYYDNYDNYAKTNYYDDESAFNYHYNYHHNTKADLSYNSESDDYNYQSCW